MARPIRCAPELQDLEIWHRYKPQLRELYIVQNKTLKKVKESMETQHGWPVFKLATYEVVLRDELRLVKNLTKDDWLAIQHHMGKRKLRSKQSEVLLHDQVVDKKRVTKATGRYRRPIISRARTPVLRNGVCIRTPPGLSLSAHIPDDIASVQLAAVAGSADSITKETLPTPRKGRNAALPRSNNGPLRIQDILAIRASTPFNQLANKLQGFWLSNIMPSQGSTSPIEYPPHLVTGYIQTRCSQQTFHVTTQDQLIEISGGSFSSNMRQLTNLPRNDDYFGVLMKACYVFSNAVYDTEVERRFLDWIGLVAEMELLMAFFCLQLPTVIAVWENSLDASYKFRHYKAFDILVKLGLTVNNGRLIRSRLGRCFAMAVDLGSSNPMGSVSRLMKAGVSLNARWDRSCLPKMYEDTKAGNTSKYCWRGGPLEQAAKNRDTKLLKLLIKDGNFRCSHFDTLYGNTLLCLVATEDPITGRPPSLPCVDAVIKAGVRVDFLSGVSDVSEFAAPLFGWTRCGKPGLLVDRTFFSDREANRDIHEVVARKSQWFKKSVTVSGIFLAAEGGLERLQAYLEAVPIPEATLKEALLQVALSEAADMGNIAVLICLLHFGVDPAVNALMARLPEEEHLQWKPVVRAATHWNPEALHILSSHGVDIGEYQLFRCVMEDSVVPDSPYSQLEKRRSLTIQFLLDAGAPVDIPQASLIMAALVPPIPDWQDGITGSTDDQRRQWVDYIANFQPDYTLCDKLQRHGISFDHGLDGCSTLQTALREGCNFATVSYLIRSGLRVHSIPWKNKNSVFREFLGDTTMLHDALLGAYVDRFKIVDLLIANGADIFATTSKGITLLEVSLMMPSIATSYPRFQYKNKREESTSIFWKLFQYMGASCVSSVEFKHQPLLSHLLELEQSNENICKVLSGIKDINNYEASNGLSLLMQAIQRYRTELVSKLVERGCDVNLRADSFPLEQQDQEPYFNTALQMACLYKPSDNKQLFIIELLLENGARVNDPPAKYGMTALQYAASQGGLGVATLLLKHGAGVNAKPGKYLYRYPDLNFKLTKGDQAVDIAASCGHLDMVHLLVGVGALSGNPGAAGLDGAMLAANRNGYIGIVEYLQQHTGHQLSEVVCQEATGPESSTSSATSTSDVSIECSDGERSCQCQPVGLDRDVGGIGEESHGPVEEISVEPGLPPAPRELSLPLRSPGHIGIFAPEGSSLPGTTPSPDAVPSAVAIAAPNTKSSDQAPTTTEPFVYSFAEEGLDDHPLQDSMKRTTTEDAYVDGSTQFRGSYDRIKVNVKGGEGHINEAGIGNGDCLTPITRGILEWMEETEFELSPG